MKPIFVSYTHEVYANLRPLHATWEPTQTIRLGDIGLLDGRTFRHQTNLAALGIAFQITHGAPRPNIWFCSNGATEIQFRSAIAAAPGIAPQQAGLDLTFSSKGAVFFHAAGCEPSTIKDKVALGKAVTNCLNSGKWAYDWVVVTDLIKADHTTIAISGQKGARLSLDAAFASPTVDMSEVGRQICSSKSQTSWISVNFGMGLTPLIGLSRMSRYWMRGAEFCLSIHLARATTNLRNGHSSKLLDPLMRNI